MTCFGQYQASSIALGVTRRWGLLPHAGKAGILRWVALYVHDFQDVEVMQEIGHDTNKHRKKKKHESSSCVGLQSAINAEVIYIVLFICFSSIIPRPSHSPIAYSMDTLQKLDGRKA